MAKEYLNCAQVLRWVIPGSQRRAKVKKDRELNGYLALQMSVSLPTYGAGQWLEGPGQATSVGRRFHR